MPGACWRLHYLANVNEPSKKHANHEINYAPSTAPCVALKNMGANIFFINTEYIVPTTGRISGHNVNRFDFIENTLHDLVDERMIECTGSADQVIRTNTPAQTATAFEDVLGDVTSPLRLYYASRCCTYFKRLSHPTGPFLMGGAAVAISSAHSGTKQGSDSAAVQKIVSNWGVRNPCVAPQAGLEPATS